MVSLLNVDSASSGARSTAGSLVLGPYTAKLRWPADVRPSAASYRPTIEFAVDQIWRDELSSTDKHFHAAA